MSVLTQIFHIRFIPDVGRQKLSKQVTIHEQFLFLCVGVGYMCLPTIKRFLNLSDCIKYAQNWWKWNTRKVVVFLSLVCFFLLNHYTNYSSMMTLAWCYQNHIGQIMKFCHVWSFFRICTEVKMNCQAIKCTQCLRC